MRTARRLLAGLFLAGLQPTAALANPLCDEMWGERNAIYFDAGYCFKTAKARAAFGDNAGCRYERLEDVPLSARQRADIAAIRARERRSGCTD